MSLSLIFVGKFKRFTLPIFLLILAIFLTGIGDDNLNAVDLTDPSHSIYLPILKSEYNGNSGNEYYISPTGNDNNSGTSGASAWATFDRAFLELGPGDSLILMDGVYYQSIQPTNQGGKPDMPITIRAQNDGKAIVDGQGLRTPVYLKGSRASYFIIEGIVARNGLTSVFINIAEHNILRRVSGYNANSDGNNFVFVIWGDNNLLEDCVAAGSGRKMILVFKGQQNTVRRCHADWQEWDGREWHDCWPWGDGIEIYNGSYNIIENSISYSRNPTYSIRILAQGGDHAIGNKVLGSMAVMAGMDEDGTPMVWGDTRPQPSQYTCVRDFNWNGQRSGFTVYESDSIVRDNLWQDILSWGNAGLGLTWIKGQIVEGTGNNRVNRATVINNGLDNPDQWGGIGTDALQADLDRYGNVTNSYIETIYTGSGYTTMNGEGARLTHRYVNGVLTNDPLWPWPMEARIQAELGYSVTDLMTNIFSQVP